MMTNKQKILSGKMYDASDSELVKERDLAHKVCRVFNSDTSCSDGSRSKLFELFGKVGENCYVESTFFCDYGYNIRLGKNVYLNFGVTILDCAQVTLGD
ncbi:MAG: hypothetical protein MK132_07170 [Lentisphaerales bacterium]|nr:hypothetical protein [Lentisphaerales bacterium]